jgi:hypothetical protein
MRLGVLLLAAALVGQTAPLTKVQDRGQASIWVDRPRADPLTVKLTDTVTVVMRIEGPAPLEVEFTEKVRSTDAWRLEAVGEPKSVPIEGNLVRWEQVFKATPRLPGAQPLKLPNVQFTDKDRPETPVPVEWQLVPFQIPKRVTKVDASEARDRAGIEELPPVPVAERPWWPWLFAGVPVLAAVALLILRRRRRPAPELTPAEAALRELDEVARLPAGDAAEVKRLHTRLSDVLRRFLEKRYDLPATRRTTPEFFAALAAASPSPLEVAPRELLGRVLDGCDLAKFAGLVPAAADCRRAVGLAREFVERTGRPSLALGAGNHCPSSA